MIKVGSVVECVNDSGCHEYGLYRNSVYTVSGLREYGKGIGITLEEIDKCIWVKNKRSGNVWRQPPPFSITRFRELNTPEQREIEVKEFFESLPIN